MNKRQISKEIEKAFSLYSAGKVDQALAVCGQVLAASPPNVDLLNLSAACHLCLGNLQQAESYWKQALRLKPDYADACYNLGVLLQEQKRYEEAETFYRQTLRLKPDYAEACNNLGALLQELKRYEEAETAYRQALRLTPDYAAAYNNLGNLLKEQKRFEEAEASYRQALHFTPDYADACYNLGNLQKEQKRYKEAEVSYRQALRLKLDYAEAHNNLGVLLKEQKRYEEAETSYRKALHLKLDYAEAHNNLGVLQKEQKRYEEAETSYRKALHLTPDYAEAHNNLGVLLQAQKRYEEAEAAYRQALRLTPDHAEIHYNLGVLLQEQKRYEEAEIAYRQTLRLKPDHGNALGLAYQCARFQCEWQRAMDDESAILNALAQGIAVPPFPLLSLPDEDGLLQRRAATLYVVERAGPILEDLPLVDARQHPQRDRLRIGYLSADLHDHATTRLLAGVIEAHNRERFAIYGYSYGPDIQDVQRLRIVNACDGFRNLAPLSDRDSAQQIVQDEIDILIDLKGFTQFYRPEISVRRPAPIIVNWLGYPGTLGHARMADYIIGDSIVTPLHMAASFSETLALLPHCYQPNDGNRSVATSPTRHEAGLPEHGFVFCSFNQSYKFGAEVFDVWCRLLKALPASVLWLLEPSPICIANLRHEAVLRNIDPDRLIFASNRPPAEHLGRLGLADLALDPFPVTSHTTGSDALWAGVPLITKIGNTFVSRVAASLLHAVGLPELVTTTWDDYFSLAVDLAKNATRLQLLRQRLIANRLTAQLFDTKRFALSLEQLYEQMWQDHGANKHTAIQLSIETPSLANRGE